MASLKKTRRKLMLRLTLKMAVIGSLSVLLLIPTAFICTLTKERSDRRQETIRKSSQAWGSAHVLAGPVLQVGSRQYFPELIKIDAAVQAESRHRGIYEIPFYSADVELTATYNLPADLAKASITLHGLRISETEIQSALLNNSWLSLLRRSLIAADLRYCRSARRKKHNYHEVQAAWNPETACSARRESD
jgi:inner membrane protein involved in colicin E2 resistance